MFIAEVVSKGKNGKSYTSILLRESYRVGSSVKTRTLAVLTRLPARILDAVRRALAQPADSLSKLVDVSEGSLRLRQAESFGAVWTVDQVARRLGISKPWFVCTADNTQAHAPSSMLALKVRRQLERAWRPLDITVEEGLRELEKLSVMELVDRQSGRVVARELPDPNALQKRLLDALELAPRAALPDARVRVGTRKKIDNERKTVGK
jgi:hypothetical protein